MEADITIYWAAVMHMHTKSGRGAREKLRGKKFVSGNINVFLSFTLSLWPKQLSQYSLLNSLHSYIHQINDPHGGKLPCRM